MTMPYGSSGWPICWKKAGDCAASHANEGMKLTRGGVAGPEPLALQLAAPARQHGPRSLCPGR